MPYGTSVPLGVNAEVCRTVQSGSCSAGNLSPDFLAPAPVPRPGERAPDRPREPRGKIWTSGHPFALPVLRSRIRDEPREPGRVHRSASTPGESAQGILAAHPPWRHRDLPKRVRSGQCRRHVTSAHSGPVTLSLVFECIGPASCPSFWSRRLSYRPTSKSLVAAEEPFTKISSVYFPVGQPSGFAMWNSVLASPAGAIA